MGLCKIVEAYGNNKTNQKKAREAGMEFKQIRLNESRYISLFIANLYLTLLLCPLLD